MNKFKNIISSLKIHKILPYIPEKQWGELPHWITFGKRYYCCFYGYMQNKWIGLKLMFGIDCRDPSIRNMFESRWKRIFRFWEFYFKHEHPKYHSFKLTHYW